MTTSVCITTFSPANILNLPPSFSYAGEMHDSNSTVSTSTSNLSAPPKQSDPEEASDIGCDFEFRLEKPVNMLPADQLFSDGKLFPINFPVVHPEAASTSSTSSVTDSSNRSTDTPEPSQIINGVSVVDSFLYSPKAPRCSSSKWKELLGLRKLYQNSSNAKQSSTGTPASGNSNGNGNTAIKSIKQFLYRTSKPSNDSSVNLPLLNDADYEPEPEPEPAVVTSRHSLSSSSSGHDVDELPRISLDSEKPLKNSNPNPNNPPRMKLVKTRTLSTDGSTRGVSTESPRMNSSGKIVFHSLERSSSSPSSFNGGPRLKHRVERSYSSNVRITPVLNVPVCSLRGFPLFSSSQKSENSSNGNGNRASKNQQMNNKSKTDRSN